MALVQRSQRTIITLAQGFGADVVTIEHPRCVEIVDDRIDLVLCGFDVGRGGFDEKTTRPELAMRPSSGVGDAA